MHFQVEEVNGYEVYCARIFNTEEALLDYVLHKLKHEAYVFAFVGNKCVDSIHITKERLNKVRDEL